VENKRDVLPLSFICKLCSVMAASTRFESKVTPGRTAVVISPTTSVNRYGPGQPSHRHIHEQKWVSVFGQKTCILRTGSYMAACPAPTPDFVLVWLFWRGQAAVATNERTNAPRADQALPPTCCYIRFWELFVGGQRAS